MTLSLQSTRRVSSDSYTIVEKFAALALAALLLTPSPLSQSLSSEPLHFYSFDRTDLYSFDRTTTLQALRAEEHDRRVRVAWWSDRETRSHAGITQKGCRNHRPRQPATRAGITGKEGPWFQ
jgi:hypothetical protein